MPQKVKTKINNNQSNSKKTQPNIKQNQNNNKNSKVPVQNNAKNKSKNNVKQKNTNTIKKVASPSSLKELANKFNKDIQSKKPPRQNF